MLEIIIFIGCGDDVSRHRNLGVGVSGSGRADRRPMARLSGQDRDGLRRRRPAGHAHHRSGRHLAATTREFRYQGDAIVEEKLDGVTTHRYLVDEAGSIVQVIIPSGVNAGTYVVTWNGHGDAMGLWRVKTDGTLELANSWTFETWGKPQVTTSHANSNNGGAAYGDLGFRFLYVGEFDVQWDSALGLDLAYMHARHYSPALGRFLQPDPSRAEVNLYGYAGNSPAVNIDPEGESYWKARKGGGGRGFGGGGRMGRGSSIKQARPMTKYSTRPVPQLDERGKIHGPLPRTQDLPRYSSGDLREMQRNLRLSVKQIIKQRIRLGPDRGHGQRQAAEQRLIKQIDKVLRER